MVETDMKGVIVWIHGLGQRAAKWKDLPQWPGMEAIDVFCPQAPTSHVTAFDEPAPNWMDMPRLPLTRAALTHMARDPRLEVSIATTHAALDAFVDRGWKPSRLAVGGFSQGGALAMLAALTYPRGRLAGAVSFSGWLVGDDGGDLQKVLPWIRGRYVRQPATPILWWHGTCDTRIPVELHRSGVTALLHLGCTAVESRTTEGMRHAVIAEQKSALGAWLESRFAESGGAIFGAEKKEARDVLPGIVSNFEPSADSLAPVDRRRRCSTPDPYDQSLV
mmetsp:Transcript_41112/g.96473  ORF Transcript_41112/g.96473 Transcript_41112/m.96473 type:complete len:277 (-) Transcript_41112:596-1426(-)